MHDPRSHRIVAIQNNVECVRTLYLYLGQRHPDASLLYNFEIPRRRIVV
jgi:hypothetical protein